MTVPPEAWDAARDAARPFAADLAEQVTRDPVHAPEIIGTGIAKAAAAAVEAAAPHIRKQIAAGRIDSFAGEYAFLSSFAPSPIRQGGQMWPTAEHLFQSMKCVGLDHRNWILAAPTPREAKRRGRSVAMRSDWEQCKRAAMLRVVLAKFEQNPDLAAKLAATYGAELVEGNTWGDRYWGRVGGVGENWLGRILMWVREVLHETAP